MATNGPSSYRPVGNDLDRQAGERLQSHQANSEAEPYALAP